MQEHFLSESANLILSIEQGVFEWKASIPPSSPSNTWCVMISDQCEATLKHYGQFFEEYFVLSNILCSWVNFKKILKIEAIYAWKMAVWV